MCWYALFSSWYNNFYFHVSLSCIGIFKKDHLFSIIISCCDEICACLVIHGLASKYTLTKNLSKFKQKYRYFVFKLHISYFLFNKQVSTAIFFLPLFSLLYFIQQRLLDFFLQVEGLSISMRAQKTVTCMVSILIISADFFLSKINSFWMCFVSIE